MLMATKRKLKSWKKVDTLPIIAIERLQYRPYVDPHSCGVHIFAYPRVCAVAGALRLWKQELVLWPLLMVSAHTGKHIQMSTNNGTLFPRLISTNWLFFRLHIRCWHLSVLFFAQVNLFTFFILNYVMLFCANPCVRPCVAVTLYIPVVGRIPLQAHTLPAVNVVLRMYVLCIFVRTNASIYCS